MHHLATGHRRAADPGSQVAEEEVPQIASGPLAIFGEGRPIDVVVHLDRSSGESAQQIGGCEFIKQERSIRQSDQTSRPLIDRPGNTERTPADRSGRALNGALHRLLDHRSQPGRIDRRRNRALDPVEPRTPQIEGVHHDAVRAGGERQSDTKIISRPQVGPRRPPLAELST